MSRRNFVQRSIEEQIQTELTHLLGLFSRRNDGILTHCFQRYLGNEITIVGDGRAVNQLALIEHHLTLLIIFELKHTDVRPVQFSNHLLKTDH